MHRRQRGRVTLVGVDRDIQLIFNAQHFFFDLFRNIGHEIGVETNELIARIVQRTGFRDGLFKLECGFQFHHTRAARGGTRNVIQQVLD